MNPNNRWIRLAEYDTMVKIREKVFQFFQE